MQSLHDHKLTTKRTRQMTKCLWLVASSVDANLMSRANTKQANSAQHSARLVEAQRSRSFHQLGAWYGLLSPTEADNEIAYVL